MRSSDIEAASSKEAAVRIFEGRSDIVKTSCLGKKPANIAARFRQRLSEQVECLQNQKKVEVRSLILIKLQQGHLLWPANATAGSAVKQADSQLHVTVAQFNSPVWPASTAAALTEARHTKKLLAAVAAHISATLWPLNRPYSLLISGHNVAHISATLWPLSRLYSRH
jgi:hypothetical protein